MTSGRATVRAAVMAVWFTLLTAPAIAGDNSSGLPADPYPAVFSDASDLQKTGFGRLTFKARDGNELTALTYRGAGFDPVNGDILFVIHGASRAVERYIKTAAPVTERNDALAIAIHFSKSYYPASGGFTLGVTTHGVADQNAYREGRWRQPEDYLYSEIEHVFEAVRQSLNGQQAGYFIFGHSAGAQFTHRMMTFLPRSRILGAVAANAGWYTLPVSGSGRSYSMPYGLRGSPLTDADVKAYLESPLTVLVGERDVATPATSSMVRGTMEAMMQGQSRVERGEYFYAMGEARARASESRFGWRFATVPKARHSAAEMIGSAGFFLFGDSQSPCSSSSAADAPGLLITEILADPPGDIRGDANNDGVRDSADDEFVEIVNQGPAAVCLTGWTLGDVTDPERHVFPIGEALQPGQALVVFGGGLPSGSFEGAEIQWAAYGGQLNLSNAGDVLTLADATGRVVQQVSWGDCAGQMCANEHIKGELGIDASVTRRQRSSGGWSKHTAVSDALFSPGVKATGARWSEGLADG